MRVKTMTIAAGLLSIIFSGFTQADAADIEKSLATCAAIKGELLRLQCYDDLASANKLTPESRTSTSGAPGSNWKIETSTNPIDDSKTVILALAAENVRSRFGRPIVLILRCQSKRTEAYVSWGAYLGSEAFVTSRIGDERSKTSQWGLSSDSQATFVPGNAVAFIQSLMKASRFVVQVTPYNESPVTAVFEIVGLTDASKPLRETCKWGN